MVNPTVIRYGSRRLVQVWQSRRLVQWESVGEFSLRGFEQRRVEALSRWPCPCSLFLTSCHRSPAGFPGTFLQMGGCS